MRKSCMGTLLNTHIWEQQERNNAIRQRNRRRGERMESNEGKKRSPNIPLIKIQE